MDAGLALVVGLGLSAVLLLSLWIDPRRPAYDTHYEDDPLYLTGPVARTLSLGFSGLVADWYWLRALQYIGQKIQEQQKAPQLEGRIPVELDRLTLVSPRALGPLLEMAVTLDPRFTAVYEYAAVVLPAVDAPAAIRLVEKGIQVDPGSWYLHQQLAYIHWQRGDYASAAEAFRRGARMTEAKWMAYMAERMEAKGGERSVAREMYARMYQQATDEQVKQWALKRLMELRWFDERDLLRSVLAEYRERAGRCPAAWTELTPRLRRLPLPVDGAGRPVDPSGAVYLLVAGEPCDVALGPDSLVPGRRGARRRER